MQTQFEAFDAEGVFDQPIKPLRIRKHKQRRKKNPQWIEMSDPITIEQRSAMSVAKLLRSSLPVMLGAMEAAHRNGLKVGEARSKLKWREPKKSFNRRIKQRRVEDWSCLCEEKRVLVDRRIRHKESREKPDKYFFNSVQVDYVKHTAQVKKPELIFDGSALGLVSNKVTALTEQREASAKRPKIRTS